ncbi:MAG: alpha/beta fold hydrolase [Pseudomonadota bacterium]
MSENSGSGDLVTLAAPDGSEIPLRIWPAGSAPVRGALQILHGLGEHADRYERFAQAANRHGYLVCAHDHRGHGRRPGQRNFFAPSDGWALLESDTLKVREHIGNIAAEAPVILLGHSMGSYLAQYVAMHYGGRFKGMILSGSTWPSRAQVFAGYGLARLLAHSRGVRKHSPLLDKLGFNAFNRRFAPARTELDWLSRDPEEVDRYVADPLCGGPFTIGLWADLLGGLLRIGTNDAINRIPGELPILITGGAKDPVGGERGMGELMLHYAETSHQRLALKIYADGRHEMLNETNRDDVMRDWLEWVDGVAG